MTKDDALAFCDRRIAEADKDLKACGPFSEQFGEHWAKGRAWKRARKLILKIKLPLTEDERFQADMRKLDREVTRRQAAE